MKTYRCLNCNKETAWTNQKTNKYCSNTCQLDYQNKSRITEWLSGKDNGTKKSGAAGWIKRYILEKQNFKCAECGIIEHNEKPIVLEIDHIDGNSYNNVESNLRCICPNCHSQSENYKNKNKGNGRAYRMIRYREGKSW